MFSGESCDESVARTDVAVAVLAAAKLVHL